jgi:hypothetical protein
VVSWQRAIGSSAQECYGFSVKEVEAGELVVAGKTVDESGNTNALVVKLGSAGEFSWAKTLEGDDFERWYAIEQAQDGGIVLAGHTKSYGAGASDAWIVKLDEDGELGWAKTYGGLSTDMFRDIKTAQGGGFFLTGFSTSYGAGGYDILLAKLEESGTLSWVQVLGGEDNDSGYSVVETSDGGVALVGYTGSYGAGSYDALVAKFSEAGAFLWARALGGADLEIFYAIQQAQDDGLVLAGYSGSFTDEGGSFVVVKLDQQGELSDCADIQVQEIFPAVTDITDLISESDIASGLSDLSLTSSAFAVDEITIPSSAVDNRCYTDPIIASTVMPTTILGSSTTRPGEDGLLEEQLYAIAGAIISALVVGITAIILRACAKKIPCLQASKQEPAEAPGSARPARAHRQVRSLRRTPAMDDSPAPGAVAIRLFSAVALPQPVDQAVAVALPQHLYDAAAQSDSRPSSVNPAYSRS